jgi:hypothetical protein
MVNVYGEECDGHDATLLSGTFLAVWRLVARAFSTALDSSTVSHQINAKMTAKPLALEDLMKDFNAESLFFGSLHVGKLQKGEILY